MKIVPKFTNDRSSQFFLQSRIFTLPPAQRKAEIYPCITDNSNEHKTLKLSEDYVSTAENIQNETFTIQLFAMSEE